MTAPTPARAALDLGTDSGIWAIRSAGPTVYLLDLNARPARCLRLPGPTSPHGLTDGTWATVVDVRAVAADGTATPQTVRVGCRTLWFFDPGPHHPDLIWWLQRLVTSIDAAPREVAAYAPTLN